jgi:hypothetical protein
MSLPAHNSATDQVQTPGAAQPVDSARGNLNMDAQNFMHTSSPAAVNKVFAEMSGSGKNQPNSADHVPGISLYDSAQGHDSGANPVAHPESSSKPQSPDRQTAAGKDSGSAAGYGEPGGIRGGPGVGTARGPGDGSPGSDTRVPVDSSRGSDTRVPLDSSPGGSGQARSNSFI